jgi:peptidoglycan/xylan/chitin deacetylase (PgdA/CDA1 family)
LTILCYHTVEPDWRSPLSVTPEVFDQHAAFLARSRRVVDLPEAVARMSLSGRLPRGFTAITFDDGFSGVLEHALPILERHELPTTIFLVAQTLTAEGKAIDWSSTAPPTARTLSTDEILAMQRPGVSFGSHTSSHPDLRSLTREQCVLELKSSRELLEDLLGRSVRFLAYPFGYHNELVRQAAEDAGYTHAFSLPEGKEPAGRYAVPRSVIVPGNGVSALRFKSSRWYLPVRRSGIFPALRRAVRGAGGGMKVPS